MKTTLCTLFDGHYHYGVAGLANSLAASGFEGTLWVGHRGPLSSWITSHRDFDGDTTLRVTPGFSLRMRAMDPPVSLNYCKADFIREILEILEPDADFVAYLDPDIVVTCEWADIQAWFNADGISLVEDFDSQLSSDHPKRIRWRQYFAEYGEHDIRPLHKFYNAGFIGIPRSLLPFVGRWQRVCRIVAEECGVGLRQRKAGAPGSLFHSTDEDALNFSLSLSQAPVYAQGPEAMDFIPGGRHLSHAVGEVKPWQGRHVRRSLRGMAPSTAIVWYYRFAQGPLSPFPILVLWKRRTSMALALGLGALFLRMHQFLERPRPALHR